MAQNGGTIEVSGLSKHFGDVRAVQDLSFSVEPGTVTGFLGPNGAGKTTTLRMLLGLVTPSSGTATIGGRPYHDLPNPLRTVGAALESSSFHPGRTARNHLRVLCAATGVPDSRTDEVLAQVGLTDSAGRKVKGFSMGMRQRLGLAATLLGDPQVLVLDEPANGLDPEGINWLRGFLRHLAADGKTVLISSHMLSEVQQTVDDVVIIARGGRLVREGALQELMDAEVSSVRVRTPQAERLRDLLTGEGVQATISPDGSLSVVERDPAKVGEFAFTNGIALHELTRAQEGLEQLFLQLTGEADAGALGRPGVPSQAPPPQGPPPQGPQSAGPVPPTGAAR